jgi:hypothetical protein
MAAPTTLPTILIRPRDNVTAGEARVTMKALSPAHQGLSECIASAASTASVTDNAASSASKPRGREKRASLAQTRARRGSREASPIRARIDRDMQKISIKNAYVVNHRYFRSYSSRIGSVTQQGLAKTSSIPKSDLRNDRFEIA